MFNYIPSQWLVLFYFYSFFGWCWETLYVSFLNKRFVNRGFMRGPFLPLYGCGGVMMLVVSRPFYDNVFLVYIAGCIGATLLEYITGLVMETLFKVRYWDYSNKKFNIKGYVCLESTLFWGICTIVFSHYLQKPIEMVLLSIPYRVISVTAIILTVYISCDFMIAFRTALDLRDILSYMDRAKEEMSRMQKRLDVIIAFKGEEVKENIELKTNGVTSGISSRVDSLSSALENSFANIKERISIEPSAYMQSAKDEVGELYAKYRILKDRLTPPPVKGFFEWYKDHTILGNPTMVSEKFKGSLEEMKDKAIDIINKKK